MTSKLRSQLQGSQHKQQNCIRALQIAIALSPVLRLQVLKSGGKCFCWTRWGRVGDAGQSKLLGPCEQEGAEKEFNSKFRSKVGIPFSDNEGARSVRPGKYSLVDLDTTVVPTPGKQPVSGSSPHKQPKVQPSKLCKPTLELMELIFNDLMFKQAMQDFDIDTDRMPLGQLSKDQVQRGYEVLERIRKALQSRSGKAPLEALSSEFYQVIPHNFKRQRPPIIADQDALDTKFEMCNVLNDIEVAQGLKEQQAEEHEDANIEPHPADEKYDSLQADLQLLSTEDPEHDLIARFVKATSSHLKLLNVWEIERQGEAKRFAKHKKLGNRKLLWHGTNIAVVAAILKAGLRIMPHSGGRVGRGLYLAAENSKSAAYVCAGRQGTQLVGVMFLAEAALGKEHHIMQDDSTLVKPPAGSDSVVAKGQTEPDPHMDEQLKLDGKPVNVPVGQVKQQPEFQHSSFMQSEYLLYEESQARLRYMVTLEFANRGRWN
ncbi:hypothetical protein WJX74_007215 [Apatococcus lobatus]|uniref:Poly [ADP-ribose] polymerase n=1 Tax=Apatococcus lobatus TaxID=904363 RepID=A0AAW1S7A8_9CHLO